MGCERRHGRARRAHRAARWAQRRRRPCPLHRGGRHPRSARRHEPAPAVRDGVLRGERALPGAALQQRRRAGRARRVQAENATRTIRWTSQRVPFVSRQISTSSAASSDGATPLADLEHPEPVHTDLHGRVDVRTRRTDWAPITLPPRYDHCHNSLSFSTGAGGRGESPLPPGPLHPRHGHRRIPAGGSPLGCVPRGHWPRRWSRVPHDQMTSRASSGRCSSPSSSGSSSGRAPRRSRPAG